VLYMGYMWEAAGGAGLLLVRSPATLTRYALVCSLYAAASGRQQHPDASTLTSGR
jgi:hypothetical protein